MKVPALGGKTFAALLATAAIAGVGTAFWLTTKPPVGGPPEVSSPLEETPTTGQAPRPVERQLSSYWIDSQDNGFVVVPVAVFANSTEEAIASALHALKGNPPANDLYSAVPPETEILSVTAKDGEVRINLSAAFGQGGGSASMMGRLVQVLYTATSLDPEAKVFLSVEGQPLTWLGGEGIEVLQPLTRKDLPANF
ncbi:MAG: GerMN domain-containing protein [Pseudanabaenaceae cyanobacterium]